MVLDEADSGLDVDALRVVAAGVNSLRGANRSMLAIRIRIANTFPDSPMSAAPVTMTMCIGPIRAQGMNSIAFRLGVAS